MRCRWRLMPSSRSRFGIGRDREHTPRTASESGRRRAAPGHAVNDGVALLGQRAMASLMPDDPPVTKRSPSRRAWSRR